MFIAIVMVVAILSQQSQQQRVRSLEEDMRREGYYDATPGSVGNAQRSSNPLDAAVSSLTSLQQQQQLQDSTQAMFPDEQKHWATVGEMLRASRLAPSSPMNAEPPLSVCIIGPPSVALSWAEWLPPGSVFVTFAPLTDGTSRRSVHHATYSVARGAIPGTVWAYFGQQPKRRCQVSIIEYDDDTAASTSSNSTAKAIGLLRSVSLEQSILLVHKKQKQHHAQVAVALDEVTQRRYVIPMFAYELRLGDRSDNVSSSEVVRRYSVRKISKDFPLRSASLDILLNSSYWYRNSLHLLNTLAKAIYKTVRTRKPGLLQHVEGNSAQLTLERKVYISLAQLPEVKTICEIGFNMGHSASLWLLANPTARVFMFDLWTHEYSPMAEQFLRSHSRGSRFGLFNVSERLTITRGSSLETVPEFARQRPDVKCDIVSVDGGHTYELGLQDIINMRALANPKFHVLLVDDTNCDAGWCVDEPCFEHERRGNIVNLLRVSEFNGLRGVSVFQYTEPGKRSQ